MATAIGSPKHDLLERAIVDPMKYQLTAMSVGLPVIRRSILAACWTVLVVGGIVGCTQPEQESVHVIHHDVADLMHLVIEPAAEKLWDSAGYIITYEGVEDLAPTTEEGWMEVIHAASVLMESGELLILPGRTEIEPEWIEFSRAMSRAANFAKDAGTEQDSEALFDAGGVIYQICRACHQQYWHNRPIRPSEY